MLRGPYLGLGVECTHMGVLGISSVAGKPTPNKQYKKVLHASQDKAVSVCIDLTFDKVRGFPYFAPSRLPTLNVRGFVSNRSGGFARYDPICIRLQCPGRGKRSLLHARGWCEFAPCAIGRALDAGLQGCLIRCFTRKVWRRANVRLSSTSDERLLHRKTNLTGSKPQMEMSVLRHMAARCPRERRTMRSNFPI